jgi:SAM-dependent methyltransferase
MNTVPCKLCAAAAVWDSRVATCPRCGLVDRTGLFSGPDYEQKSGRNNFCRRYVERKLEDRLRHLRRFGFKRGLRVLDAGCAEGELGGMVKKASRWTVHGLEVSEDRVAAAARLDRVFSRLEQTENGYDLILCFHVVEHVADLSFLSNLGSLLCEGGRLVLEVPHATGHRFVGFDGNAEHLYGFTLNAAVTLAERAGLVVTESSTGHYESPAYSDCLRLVCQRRRDYFRQRDYPRLVDPLRNREVVVFGVGGDFRSFVLPILSGLRVAGVYTTSRCEVIPSGMRRIESMETGLHEGRVVLLASVRFEDEMRAYLRERGWPEERIFPLGRLLDRMVESIESETAG